MTSKNSNSASILPNHHPCQDNRQWGYLGMWTVKYYDTNTQDNLSVRRVPGQMMEKMQEEDDTFICFLAFWSIKNHMENIVYRYFFCILYPECGIHRWLSWETTVKILMCLFPRDGSANVALCEKRISGN